MMLRIMPGIGDDAFACHAVCHARTHAIDHNSDRVCSRNLIELCNHHFLSEFRLLLRRKRAHRTIHHIEGLHKV